MRNIVEVGILNGNFRGENVFFAMSYRSAMNIQTWSSISNKIGIRNNLYLPLVNYQNIH